MKLLSYILNGSILGIETESWDIEDLNGNEPFKKIEDNLDPSSNYSDISSISGWGKFGELTFSDQSNSFDGVRDEIKKLMTPSQLEGDLSGLSNEEIKYIENYKLREYFKIYDFMGVNYDSENVAVAPSNFNYH